MVITSDSIQSAYPDILGPVARGGRDLKIDGLSEVGQGKRFNYGPVPENEIFLPEQQSWSGILEPSALLKDFLAVPAALILLLVSIDLLSLAWEGGPLAMWLAIVALVKSVLSSGDAIGFVLIISQIPGGARVKNKGWDSYWKMK